MIAELFATEAWGIVQDLIDEGVASVCGRKTNGYYQFGELSRGTKPKEYCSGYQDALMQLSNRVTDFVIARDRLLKKKKDEATEAKQDVYNPFLEEEP